MNWAEPYSRDGVFTGEMLPKFRQNINVYERLSEAYENEPNNCLNRLECRLAATSLDE